MTLIKIDLTEKFNFLSPDERLVIGALLDRLGSYALDPKHSAGEITIVGCEALELNVEFGVRKITKICEELVNQGIFQRQERESFKRSGNAPKSKNNWYSFNLDLLENM
ncbi:MAG TPA: hypothetical protein VK308_02510 [Pyrinomonadaceae bacterium]|nr:hypothetical protein [Pyrinomonadaceae bacterium]